MMYIPSIRSALYWFFDTLAKGVDTRVGWVASTFMTNTKVLVQSERTIYFTSQSLLIAV